MGKIIMLSEEFFDARLIMCITFLDKPGEGSSQAVCIKFGTVGLLMLFIALK
jgi:hypothetical protein